MMRPFPWVLLAILAVLAGVDAAWILERHFDIDWPAYSGIACVAAAVWGLGIFYATKRKDEQASAMLFGAGFLVAFSTLASVTNYFLLTVAGHRIDGILAEADRALGINWPMMIAWASEHRALNLILIFAYGCALPEIALLIPLLGWRSPTTRIYSFCFAMAFAAVMTIGFWTLFPSFGAISVYPLSPSLVAHTPLALGPDYARELVRLLANGPGYISPAAVKGLIGFPSFHAVLAVLAAWYAASLRYLRLPVLALNAIVLISIPIQGGHHVVDVLGGVIVAALSILAAERLTAFLARLPAAARSAEPLSGQWSAGLLRD